MKKRNFGYLILLLGCVSCATSNMQINYMEPAPAPVDFRVKALGIATGNCNIENHGSITTPARKEFEQEQLSSFAIVGPAAKEGLLLSQQFPRVITIPGYIDIKGAELNARELEKIQLLCADNSVGAIIWISQFYAHPEKKHTKKSTEKRGDFIHTSYTMEVGAIVKGIYAADGTLFYSESNSEVFFKELDGVTRAENEKQLPDEADLQRKLQDQLGYKIAALFYEKPRTVHRTFFTKGDSFKKGHHLVVEKQWDKAFAHFLIMYHDGDDKTKRRSAYNLAIIQEKLGNLNAAISWLEEYEKFRGKFSDMIQGIDQPSNYKNQLRFRN
ncbi:MAG: hypothetical protein ACI9YL_000104 [Luteibaculaceae bacterium]|jgi:hypothetical protein